MAKWWSEAEALSQGLYDPPGSSAAQSLAREVQSLSGRNASSDLFTPRFGDWGNATVTPGGGLGGSTKIEPAKPTPLNPSTWKLPALEDVVKGVMAGPGGGDPVAVGLQAGTTSYIDSVGAGAKEYISGIGASFEAWVPRIILVVLGLVFVAIGLSMFGIRNPIATEIKKRL